jgi:hypothetical protein
MTGRGPPAENVSLVINYASFADIFFYIFALVADTMQ